MIVRLWTGNPGKENRLPTLQARRRLPIPLLQKSTRLLRRRVFVNLLRSYAAALHLFRRLRQRRSCRLRCLLRSARGGRGWLCCTRRGRCALRAFLVYNPAHAGAFVTCGHGVLPFVIPMRSHDITHRRRCQDKYLQSNDGEARNACIASFHSLNKRSARSEYDCLDSKQTVTCFKNTKNYSRSLPA